MRGTLRAVTGETSQGVKIRICHQMDTMCKETVIKGNNENPSLSAVSLKSVTREHQGNQDQSSLVTEAMKLGWRAVAGSHPV